jgi:hypothetical protein
VQYGIEALRRGLAAAGALGAIVPDVPLEELDALRPPSRRGAGDAALVAPTTPPERALALPRPATASSTSSRGSASPARGREPDFAWIEERVAAAAGARRPAGRDRLRHRDAAHVRRAVELPTGDHRQRVVDAYGRDRAAAAGGRGARTARCSPNSTPRAARP